MCAALTISGAFAAYASGVIRPDPPINNAVIAIREIVNLGVSIIKKITNKEL